MSSGRESVGDLVPQDVLEVFTKERQGRKGKRGRRRGSISRALGWFKGRRKKSHRMHKEFHIDLLTPGTPVPIPLPTPNTASKVENAPRPPEIENVFIEGNRSKYMEDLHTEAQQSLKALQQDENKNGIDYQDDQSVISTVTVRTDDDMSFSELRMSECESTAADTISTRSTISYQSSRSGLTRQASTFRPLNQDKKPGKSKSKGRNRSTVLGIPRHVQKELGLDRAAWTASQFTDAQLSNGGVVISTVIPNLDSISVSLEQGAQNAEMLQTVKEDETHLPPSGGNKNDLAIIQHLLPQALDPQRPRSLAVPWMTTTDSHPPSPVMYVSPQATYLSKIIPNAVLPPSVDVVELSRNRSRSSVRMVSKSSLASASPASTRASSRASSRMSSRPSSRFSSRAPSRFSSQHSGPRSDCSGWSRSGSSETLVSDSSTISSSSTPRVASRASQEEDTDGLPIVNTKGKSVIQITNVQHKHDHFNGDSAEDENRKKSGSPGPFSRSLSVMKKSRNPPPPPNRSYSLHKRHHGNPAHLEAKWAPKPSSHKKELWPDPSSQDKSSQENRDPEFLLSHSGCTSQSGSQAIPFKGLHPASNESQRAVLAELEMKKNLRPTTSNTSHSHINGEDKLKNSQASFKNQVFNGVVHSPAVMALRSLFDIPAPPTVVAPPPPPPETWAHNQRTFELLCGPGPVNLERWAEKRGLKFELPASKAPVKIPDIVSAPTTSSSTEINVLSVTEKSCSSDPSREKFQSSPSTKVKDNIFEAHKKMMTQNQEAMVSDTQSRTISTKVSSDVQPSYGNGLSILKLTKVHPSPSPSPPPEHQPPLPPINPIKASKEDVSVPKAQFRIPFEEIICPPPHPLFPPPPPPTNVSPPHPPVGQDEVDFPPPPPPFSPKTLQNMPLLPQDVPPPPQEEAKASPTPKIPSPPQEPPPPVQEVSSTQTQITDLQVNIPLPPPLPTDVKKETKIFTADKQEKQQTPQTVNPIASKEETASPMVTQSLLQKVRLRSVKQNLSQAEVSAGLPKPKLQNTAISQEPPQKPIRRSLIMIAPPPDLATLSATDPNDAQPITITQENQGTTPESNTQMTAETQTQSCNTDQEVPQVLLDSTSLPAIIEPNTQTTLTDQTPSHTSTKPNNESVPAGPVTQPPSNKEEPGPGPQEPEVQDAQNTGSEPPPVLNAAEQKDQPVNSVKVKTSEHEIKQGTSETEEKPNSTLLQSQLEVTLPKPQKVISTPKVSPAHKPPPATIPVTSRRLEEAIRMKTAALSKENQVKSFGLHSPPPSASISPSTTANFIFSKNPKKVVIEAPSSPVAQADLKKSLVSELSSVSQPIKPSDSQNKTIKIPPPVAKKPNAKAENDSHNSAETETTAETEHVQTAGQQAQPEN